MLRVVLIAFLIAHGLVHLAIWAPKDDPEKATFDPAHSWLIDDRRPLARLLAFSATAILIVAGIALWVDVGWWWPTAVVGLIVSTVLLLLFLPVVRVHSRRQHLADRRHWMVGLAVSPTLGGPEQHLRRPSCINHGRRWGWVVGQAGWLR